MKPMKTLAEFIEAAAKTGPRQRVYVTDLADFVTLPDGSEYEGYFVVASTKVDNEVVRYFEPAEDDWDAMYKRRDWGRALVRRGIDPLRILGGRLPSSWPPAEEELAGLVAA
jgi:hypothetical protein